MKDMTTNYRGNRRVLARRSQCRHTKYLVRQDLLWDPYSNSSGFHRLSLDYSVRWMILSLLLQFHLSTLVKAIEEGSYVARMHLVSLPHHSWFFLIIMGTERTDILIENTFLRNYTDLYPFCSSLRFLRMYLLFGNRATQLRRTGTISIFWTIHFWNLQTNGQYFHAFPLPGFLSISK